MDQRETHEDLREFPVDYIHAHQDLIRLYREAIQMVNDRRVRQAEQAMQAQNKETVRRLLDRAVKLGRPQHPQPCPIWKDGGPCNCPEPTPLPSRRLYATAELIKLGSAALSGTPESSTPAPDLGAIGSERGLAEPSKSGSAALGGTPEPSPPTSNLPAIGSERAAAHAQGQPFSGYPPNDLVVDLSIWGFDSHYCA